MIDEALWQELVEEFHEADQECSGPLADCSHRWEHEILATETLEVLETD